MIFISYRRDDSLQAVDRLHTVLAENIRDVPIFRDAGGMEPSVVFPPAIQQAIRDCELLLAVVGPTWATYGASGGAARLRDPDDWVHHEIVAALEGGRRVLPVLVEGAAAPTVADLPADLAPLAALEPLVLRPEAFLEDAERLAAVVGDLLGATVVEHPDEESMGRVRAALAALDRLVAADMRMDDLRPFRDWFDEYREALLAASHGVAVASRLEKLARSFDDASGGEDATWELSVFEIREALRDLRRLFGVPAAQEPQAAASGLRILPGARSSEFPVGGAWECAAEGRGWKAIVSFTLGDDARFTGVLKTPRVGVARLLGAKRDRLSGNYSMQMKSVGGIGSLGGAAPQRAVGLRLHGAHADGEPFEWLIPIDQRVAGGYTGRDRDGARYFLRRR